MPEDEFLDHAVGEFGDLVRQELQDTATQSVFGEVIDWTAVDDMKIDLANKFTALAGASSDAERESMLRGALFARQVLHMIYADRVVLLVHEYCGDFDVDELREKIDTDTQAYLATAPNLRELLAEWMHEIDQERGYAASAAKMSALIFMLVEFYVADQYVRNSFDALSPEMFA